MLGCEAMLILVKDTGLINPSELPPRGGAYIISCRSFLQMNVKKLNIPVGKNISNEQMKEKNHENKLRRLKKPKL